MPTVFEPRKNIDSNVINHSLAPKHRFLHAYCFNPHIRFETQQKDEKVILMLRSHPITQLPWIVTSIVLLFIPTLITIFLHDFASFGQIVFSHLIWYAFIFSYIFINILNYIFNVGLITTHRVVDIDYHFVLYKEVNQTTFGNIEDVTTKTGGFLRSLLNYGDVFVQTAGAEANIEFFGAPDPTAVATMLNRVMSGEKIL